MSYSGTGQYPRRAYIGGIFGQVEDISYDDPLLPGTVFVEPPSYQDGPIKRIEQSSLPAFKWSINSTTTTDEAAGSSVAGLTSGSWRLEIASVPLGSTGDYWLDGYVADGYVVVFQTKTLDQLSPILSFYASSDPAFLAGLVSSGLPVMFIDGPEGIIDQTKQLLAGGVATTPPVTSTPPGTAIPGLPTPPPGSTPAGNCGPNQMDIYGLCLNMPPCPPGEKEQLGLCYPDLPLPVPPGTTPPGATPPATTAPPGTTPPATTPPGDKTTVATTGAPNWVLPAIAVVAVVSIGAIAMASKKKKASAAA